MTSDSYAGNRLSPLFCPLCLSLEVNLEHLALWYSHEACQNLCYITVMLERSNFSVCLSLANSPQWTRASSFTRFLDQTQRRTTVSRTPLDEWSARRKDLYLTTHDTHNRKKFHSPGCIFFLRHASSTISNNRPSVSAWLSILIWTLEDVEAPTQHVCRCGRSVLPLFQTDDG